jgi:hypothetical protein
MVTAAIMAEVAIGVGMVGDTAEVTAEVTAVVTAAVLVGFKGNINPSDFSVI